MTATAYIRGHRVYSPDGDTWRYVDTDGEVRLSPDRDCGHCGRENTPEGHDGCLGTLPGVMNACCGHGISGEAYIQYPSGLRVAGNHALNEIRALTISRL